MQLEDQKEIVEGVTQVSSALPPPQLASYLRRVLQPVLESVSAILTSREAAAAAGGDAVSSLPPGSSSVKTVCQHLDLIAEVWRVVDYLPLDNNAAAGNGNGNGNGDASGVVVAAVMGIVTELWPLLQRVMHAYTRDEKVIEKLLRGYKFVIKGCKGAFAPMLQSYITELIQVYHTVPSSAILYSFSICVDCFARVPAFADAFSTVLGSFAERTLFLLKDADAFTEYPDVVEDFCELLSRFLIHRPALLVTHAALPSIMQCLLNGMHVAHREACSSLMQFVDKLVKAARGEVARRRGGGDATPEEKAEAAALVGTLAQTLQHFGASSRFNHTRF
jgi:hypothetical protein